MFVSMTSVYVMVPYCSVYVKVPHTHTHTHTHTHIHTHIYIYIYIYIYVCVQLLLFVHSGNLNYPHVSPFKKGAACTECPAAAATCSNDLCGK